MKNVEIGRGTCEGQFDRSERLGYHRAKDYSVYVSELITMEYKGTYVVTVDNDAILRMVKRAAQSKGKKAKIGPLVVRVSTVEKEVSRKLSCPDAKKENLHKTPHSYMEEGEAE